MVQVRVGVPGELKNRVKLADIVITVPEQVSARIVAAPSPSFPQQATLLFSGPRAADGTLTITARVRVTAAQPMPVGLRLVEPGDSEATMIGVDQGDVRATLTLSWPGNSPGQRQNGGRGSAGR